jgi:predicted CXXCH cytochrome family protein
MPNKTKSILIVLVIIVSLLLVVGSLKYPRLLSGIVNNPIDAIHNAPDLEKNYIDASLCKKCHFKIDSLYKSGQHKKLNCQLCHGPGYKHIVSPSIKTLVKQTDKKYCIKCHAKSAIRSSKVIRQIDILKHNNSSTTCIKCHDPHTPAFKMVDQGSTDKKEEGIILCFTCHEDINNLRLKGKHKNITCQRCHGQGTEHVLSPSPSNMSKPISREFCGKCHGASITSGKIKQVDMKEHNPDMKCTECHSVHNPPEFK